MVRKLESLQVPLHQQKTQHDGWLLYNLSNGTIEVH